MSSTEVKPAAHDESSARAGGGGSSRRRRIVPARLQEATPAPLGYWLLAAPLLLFLAWVWLDLFLHYSPITWRSVDLLLGALAFVFLLLLPLGLAAHWFVTALPGLFQNAGWDVAPLESVTDAEKYSVRYRGVERHRAPASGARLWLRAAQGWVYLEIAVILLAGVLLIPLFLSAVNFGFGR